MSKPSLLFGEVADDEPLFSNKGGSSGLSSLFGSSAATNTKAADASLTYQAPKQPAATTTTVASSTSTQKKPVSNEPPQVIFALPVQLFQFDAVSSKYKQIGKVGAAILGNRQAAKYQLLLYHSNKQQIALVNISSDFGFTIQNNVYANFYDESKQNWSLLFRSQEEAIKFAYQVVLARSGSLEFKTPIYQELIVGPKGKGAQIGDTITVKYSIFGETAGQVGNAIDSPADPIKFRLGEASLMPRSIEDQIVGLKKTGRRVIVTSMENSPYKLINSNVTANSVLLLDLELIKLKKNERTGSVSKPKLPDLSSSLPDTDSTSSLSLPSVTEDTPLPSPSVATVTTTNADQESKGDLLARMAKLGRPAMGGVLPTKSTNAKLEADVEESPSIQTVPTPLQTPAPTPIVNTPTPSSPVMNGQQHIPMTTSTPVSTHMIANPQQQQQLLSNPMLNNPYDQQQQQQQQHSFYGGNTGYSTSHTHMYNPAMYNTTALNAQQRDWRMPVPGNNPPPVDTLSLLMEERQFQTDIKASLTSVSSKVSEIYTKLEHSSLFQSGKSEIPGLLILQNIQRIIEENEKLKIDLNQKTEYIDTLRGKISVLHEKNEKMIEENNRIMEQRNESLKESSEQTRKRLIDLLEEKTKLERELNDVSLTLSDTNRQLGALNRQYVNTKAELTSTQEEVERLTKELDAIRMAKNTSENSAKHLSNSLEQETQLRQLTERELSQAKIRNDQLSKELTHLQLLNSEKDNEHLSKIDSMQKSFANERQTFEHAIEQLRDTLNKERLASGAATKDMLDRIEKESESKYSMLLQDRERILSERFEQESRHKEEEFTKEINILKDQLNNLQSLSTSKEDTENLISKIKELQEELLIAKNSSNNAATAPAPSSTSNASQADTVKKIMNGIYFSLYDQFEEEESYTGDTVLQALMSTIKETTLKMLQDTSAPKAITAGEQVEEEEEEEEEEDKSAPPVHVETQEEQKEEEEVIVPVTEQNVEENTKEDTADKEKEESDTKPQSEESEPKINHSEEREEREEREEEQILKPEEIEETKEEQEREEQILKPEEKEEEERESTTQEVEPENEEEESKIEEFGVNVTETDKEEQEEKEEENEEEKEEEKADTLETEKEEGKEEPEKEEEEKKNTPEKEESKSGLFDNSPKKKSSNPLFEDDEDEDQKDAWKSFLNNNL